MATTNGGLDLAVLGISQDELQERVVARMADQLLSGVTFDEDGDEHAVDSRFRRKLDALIQERIDATIASLAEKHVLPNVTQMIETMTLQETTRWGERRGQPVTFIEYLVQRADAYMREEVNYEGKTKDQSNGYSWSKSGTRIAYLINSHLHYSIETAMKKALENANGSIRGGLESAIKTALDNVTSNLKVSIETKSR